MLLANVVYLFNIRFDNVHKNIHQTTMITHQIIHTEDC